MHPLTIILGHDAPPAYNPRTGKMHPLPIILGYHWQESLPTSIQLRKYCKRRKAGRGLGTRLQYRYILVFWTKHMACTVATIYGKWQLSAFFGDRTFCLWKRSHLQCSHITEKKEPPWSFVMNLVLQYNGGAKFPWEVKGGTCNPRKIVMGVPHILWLLERGCHKLRLAIFVCMVLVYWLLPSSAYMGKVRFLQEIAIMCSSIWTALAGSTSTMSGFVEVTARRSVWLQVTVYVVIKELVSSCVTRILDRQWERRPQYSHTGADPGWCKHFIPCTVSEYHHQISQMKGLKYHSVTVVVKFR